MKVIVRSQKKNAGIMLLECMAYISGLAIVMSLAYGAYAKQSGIDLSMGSIGDPWDNAVAESFFASLEKELIRRERFATREQARLRVFWYIECFYNPRRRHSSLSMLSPIDYEQRHQQEAIAA